MEHAENQLEANAFVEPVVQPVPLKPRCSRKASGEKKESILQSIGKSLSDFDLPNITVDVSLESFGSIPQSMGKSLSDFDFPNITADVSLESFGCYELQEECPIVVQDEDILARHSLNIDQKAAYDTIMRNDDDSPGMARASMPISLSLAIKVVTIRNVTWLNSVTTILDENEVVPDLQETSSKDVKQQRMRINDDLILVVAPLVNKMMQTYSKLPKWLYPSPRLANKQNSP
ncbi:hypothetical protein CTI12_AA356450 [Artemisia annua]|uniref:Uncharacterized protein n=1 Tax=Artemisia annua TaxID=35608 RepID=A0A2U1MPX1_ARTAN|nr:hypothetical protein CTI12_AA356450 [Artemisia annua]